MKKIHLFRNMSKESIIAYMMKDNFNKYIGFVPRDGLNKDKGQRVDLPRSIEGYMIAQRRHVFFFWQKECLIQQETKDGVFFTWVKRSSLEFE